LDGIIVVYKERGFTSHDVVAKLRGILGQRKIGHTGTLDPEAEGVLPVCLGKATKVCDMLTDWDKEYCATLLLGRTTDTQDTTGRTLRECPVFLSDADGEMCLTKCVGTTAPEKDDSPVSPAKCDARTGSAKSDSMTGTAEGSGMIDPAEIGSTAAWLPDDSVVCLTEDAIRRCIEGFVGEQRQVPPMYSALKVDGKKLYELARQGVWVERKPRRITIKDIQIESVKAAGLSTVEVEMKVRCSKGTYIRTLCNDIGEKLGCGGCLAHLLRMQVGPFSLADSYQLSEIEEFRDKGGLGQCLYSTDTIFSNMTAVRLTPEAEKLVRNGNPLSRRILAGCEKYDWLDEEEVRFSDKKGWEYGNWMILQGRSQMEVFESAPDGPQSLSAALRNKWLDPDRVRLYGKNWEFLAVYKFNKEKNIWRAEKMFL